MAEALCLICGDASEHLRALLQADAIVTDPPYGIGYRVNARAFSTRSQGLKSTSATVSRPFGTIAGDDRPFRPDTWLVVPAVAFFGAQHFSDRLPIGRWLVWDKRRESKPDDHSDCDLIWMTGDSREAMRVHRQKWRGIVREGEENCPRSKKLHPNQKPVALMTAIIERLAVPRGSLIADPYMGSGSTGVAALRLGHRFVGCEVDPDTFSIAQTRLSAELAALAEIA